MLMWKSAVDKHTSIYYVKINNMLRFASLELSGIQDIPKPIKKNRPIWEPFNKKLIDKLIKSIGFPADKISFKLIILIYIIWIYYCY